MSMSPSLDSERYPALALGTAQFGLDYGVTNRSGRLSCETISKLLRDGAERGWRWLDTAGSYGNAEKILGSMPEAASYHICTKLGANDHGHVDDLRSELDDSLSRLRRAPDIVLLHRSSWLSGRQSDDVRAWVAEEKLAGRMGAFGISIYDVSEMQGTLEGVDWVQLPLSVLSQDWLLSGRIDALRAAGIKVQIRSVLAQGLLAVRPDQLPDSFGKLRETLHRLHECAQVIDVSPVVLALSFAAQTSVDMIVVGAENAVQFEEICTGLNTKIQVDWPMLAHDDVNDLDPRRWAPRMRIGG